MTSKTIRKVLDSPVEVLLVEDNPGDVRLFLEEFKDIDESPNIHVVTNGEEGLKFLHREEEYVNAPKPNLLVLDVYLPIKSGFEILAEMGNDKELSEIPVVVFSSSPIEKDDIENIDKIPNLIFLSKPNNLKEYDDVINIVGEFWGEMRKI